MTDSTAEIDPEVVDLVADVVDDFRARRARGEDPSPEEYAARHPQAASAIRGVLAVLRLVAPAGPAADPPAPGPVPVAGVLGDYRIVREVGRGGMGVVYEAEQISLSRRVALKVLPFAALADPRLLQRFHNEARAAAVLDHPHVVKVYGVGQERGVHFIAMQFVDGRPLSELIAAVHGRAAADPTVPLPAGPAADTGPVARLSTLPDARATDFARRAAGLGVQAAEALEHAHSLGVVHRDVKPGNLLLDARGDVWVSDFGLAKVAAGDAGVTLTGDVFGTLRYMSPEQALAKHDLVDHRTDVYALGATLYELLAGRPAVDANDRADILRQITDADPIPLRRWDRSIPADLETVVLKCLRKEPNDRYASAKELADGQGLPEREPAGHHLGQLGHAVVRPQGQGRPARGVRDPEEGQVGLGVRVPHLGGIDLLVLAAGVQDEGDRGGPVDHVLVGDEQAGWVDAEGGPGPGPGRELDVDVGGGRLAQLGHFLPGQLLGPGGRSGGQGGEGQQGGGGVAEPSHRSGLGPVVGWGRGSAAAVRCVNCPMPGRRVNRIPAGPAPASGGGGRLVRGCADEQILGHCRGEGPHIRGYRVVPGAADIVG